MRSRRLSIPLPLLLALAIALGTVRTAVGEEPPEGDHAAAPAGAPETLPVDATLASITATLEALKDGPPAPGHEGVLEDAWRRHLHRRLPRALRGAERVGREGAWIEAAKGPDATPGERRIVRLDPAAWSPFSRAVASLHTDLGESMEGLGEVEVSPERARRAWLREHPRPVLLERPASEPALAAVDRAIAVLVARGEAVPLHLERERDVLARRVAAELAILWEEARRRYAEEKEAAFAAIDAQVDATRAVLEEAAGALEARQRDLRALVAAAQEAEEKALAARVEALTDAAARAEAQALLREMAGGRQKALVFRGPGWSRYGHALAQDWNVVRKKLESRLARAEGAAEEAPSDDDDADEDGTGEAGASDDARR